MRVSNYVPHETPSDFATYHVLVWLQQAMHHECMKLLSVSGNVVNDEMTIGVLSSTLSRFIPRTSFEVIIGETTPEDRKARRSPPMIVVFHEPMLKDFTMPIGEPRLTDVELKAESKP